MQDRVAVAVVGEDGLPELASAAPTIARSAERRQISREHVPALDGVRGVAILLVMVHHIVKMPATRAYELPLVYLASCGWVGVDLFFALSGYLITGILIDTRGSPRYARAFFSRRALRIVPLYVAVVIVLTMLLPIIARFDPAGARVFAAKMWWYWTYSTNILIARAGDWWIAPLNTSHFWSLAVEEQFYLVWPILVALCPPRRLGVACLVVAASSAVLRCVLVHCGVSSVAIYTLTPTHMDALALGGALAAARRDERVWRRLGCWFRSLSGVPGPRWWSMAVLGLSGMVLLDPGGYEFAAPMQTLGYPLIALASVVFVGTAAVASRDTALARSLTSRAMRTLGRYSYGLYVVHYPILYGLQLVGFDVRLLPPVHGSRIPTQLLTLVVAGTLSFGAAWLSYHGLERHFLRLKRYVPVPSEVCAG